MDQPLSRIFAEFPINPILGGKAMRRLLESDPGGFLQSALPVLRSAPQTQSFSYLLTLLLMNGMILERLTDPELFSFDEAVHLARRMLRIEPLLDIKMVRTLLDTKDLSSREELEKKASTDRGMRLLEILAAISDGARILPIMAQLLRHPNPKVRSKAALLVGRTNRNYQWVEQRLLEPDARVRANALESLWGVDCDGARQVLWHAASDPDSRVAVNALHGLYQLGEPASIPSLLQMLNDPRPEFRISALWAAGETGDPRFLPVLADLMSGPESKIRAAAFQVIAKLKQISARFSSQARLAIHIGEVKLLSDGWRALRVSVSVPHRPGEPAALLLGLKATQFIVHDGAALVTQYEAVEENRTESLCLGFGIPRVIETSDEWHRRMCNSFANGIRHKRKSDAWVSLRYQCQAKRNQPTVSRSSKTIPRIDENSRAPEPLMIAPDMHFSTEADTILAAVESPGSRMSSAADMAQAARILMAAIAGSRGSRHIVLVHHPLGGTLTPDELRELVHTARAGRISVHVIAAACDPLLVKLCSKTDGYFVHKPEQDVARSFETLCANLLSHYQVRFQVTDADAAATCPSIRIQVFSDQASGEESWSQMTT